MATTKLIDRNPSAPLYYCYVILMLHNHYMWPIVDQNATMPLVTVHFICHHQHIHTTITHSTISPHHYQHIHQPHLNHTIILGACKPPWRRQLVWGRSHLLTLLQGAQYQGKGDWGKEKRTKKKNESFNKKGVLRNKCNQWFGLMEPL